MIRSEIDHHFDIVRMRSGNQVVKRRPRIRAITEMLFDPHEVTSPIPVIADLWTACGAVCVSVDIIHGRRYPDRRDAHPLQIGHLLLNPGEISSPIGVPVGVSGIIQAGTLRRVVVRGVAIHKTVGHDLVDDLFLKILPSQGCKENAEKADQLCEKTESHGGNISQKPRNY